MKHIMILLCAVALAGCAELAHPEVQIDARDDSFCRQAGAMPGTQMYYDCRLQQAHDRALIAAGARATTIEPTRN